MSHYDRHVFFCTNRRENGEACNNHRAADDLLVHARRRFAQTASVDRRTVRINRAGCLGRCDAGPAIVVYPEGTWYTYVDTADIDEIVDEHLVNGRIVERLLIDAVAAR
jgi:(2Fe-2S) ferredoxin